KEVAPETATSITEGSNEKSLLEQMQTDPARVENYLELATLFAAQHRLREAEQILTQALAVTGGGDLMVRERLEGIRLQGAQQQGEIAKRRAEQEKTPETIELAKRMEAQANQIELEIFAARSAREPSDLRLKFELGLRAKRAGKFKEAIQAFQAA